MFEKAKRIKTKGKWAELRKDYLKMKNENTVKGKKSRHIYRDSVNNIYNKYFL